MTIERQIESIRASFEMAGFVVSEEDERRVREILEGKISIGDAIAELDEKYGIVRDEKE